MSERDFEANARKLLLHRILQGSMNGVDYAPDFRNGKPGPLTIQITQILRRHADLWALEMRTRLNPSSEDGRVLWLAQMREADAEIKRFVGSHTLGRGAAA